MLELIGEEKYKTVSKSSATVEKYISKKIDEKASVNFAEFGVGVGATTLSIAKMMDNNGSLHIFDYDYRVKELSGDLNNIGFFNIVPHGNSEKHWDSYHWSLRKLINSGIGEFFDVIYIDGAHTYLHDALIFFMCDRVLKVGGIMIFDDWFWSFANSTWMKDTRDQFMTKEQASACQVKYLLEELVNNHIGYKEVEKLTVYEKVERTSRQYQSYT